MDGQAAKFNSTADYVASEQLLASVNVAIALQKPVVIECIIEEDDKVFPMVPAGAPISDVFDAEDLEKRN